MPQVLGRRQAIAARRSGDPDFRAWEIANPRGLGTKKTVVMKASGSTNAAPLRAGLDRVRMIVTMCRTAPAMFMLLPSRAMNGILRHAA